MGDYTKQTWVDDDGSGTVGTLFTAARMGTIEQGVHDATKQASMDSGSAFDGSNATTNDTKRITWRRTSDGAYVASSEGYESGSGATQLDVVQDRVEVPGVASSVGAKARRVLEARARRTVTGTIETEWVRLIVEAIAGGGGAVRVETTPELGTDPTYSAYLLDDKGYSDWVRVLVGTYAARPTASGSNENQFYWTTDKSQLFFNPNGATWVLLYGPMEASAITTPSTGFGTHYLNYTSSFRYWKDSFGIVHVVGEINDDGTGLASVSSASGGAIIWDGFPSGYRPIGRSYFPLETNVAGAMNHILINTSGQIRVSDNFGNNPGRYMNFGHLTFPTF